MIEYTPSILDIKHALRNRGATEAEATRAIAEIKAEAWEEGFKASESNGAASSNPYRLGAG